MLRLVEGECSLHMLTGASDNADLATVVQGETPLMSRIRSVLLRLT